MGVASTLLTKPMVNNPADIQFAVKVQPLQIMELLYTLNASFTSYNRIGEENVSV